METKVSKFINFAGCDSYELFIVFLFLFFLTLPILDLKCLEILYLSLSFFLILFFFLFDTNVLIFTTLTLGVLGPVIILVLLLNFCR